MSKSLDRSQRAGSDPLIIGSSKLATDLNNNLSVLDNNDAPKKLIASELEIGDSSNKVIIKKGSDNKVAFQTQASGQSATDSNAGGGVTVVADLTALQALTGNAVGDLAFVSANNKLYLRQSAGWYTVATLSNATPVISSAGNASYTFATDGTPIVITVTATDAEGETITYGHTVTGSASGIATITQGTGANVNQFTLTPATSGSGGSFSAVFTAQDPNGNTATSSSSSFTLAFEVSGSLYFDGSGDYISTPSSSDFQMGTGDFTIEAWVYSTSYSNNPYILDLRAGGGSPTSQPAPLIYIDSSNNINYYVNGSAQISTSYSSYQNKWTHISVVKNSGTTTLFLDGVSKGTYSDSVNYNQSNSQAIIGMRSGYNSQSLNGYISNLRIVKGSAVYTSNFTPPNTPLTAINNTVYLIASNIVPTQVTSGSYYIGSTSNSYVDTSTSTDFTLGTNNDFTVEFWYKFGANSISNGGYLFDMGSNTLTVYASSTSVLSVWGAGGTVNNGGSNVGTSVGVWHHMVVQRAGNVHTFYINGQLQNSKTDSSNVHNFNGNKLRIGNYGGGSGGPYGQNAYYSDFRFVKGTAVYSGNFTPPSGPLTLTGGTYPSNTNVNTSIPSGNTKLLTANHSSGSYDDDSDSNHTLTAVGTVSISEGYKIDTEDASSSSHTLNFYGNLAYSYATPFLNGPGGSVLFDGNGDAVTVTASADFAYGTGDFTIEAWVYSTTYANFPYILDGRTNTGTSSNAPALYIHSNNNINYYVAGSNQISTSYSSYHNKWTHISIVRNSGITTLFLDGVSKGTWSDSTNYTDQGPVVLGRHGNSSNATYCLNGYISNLRIVKGTAVYTSNFTVPTSSLTAITNTKLLTCNDSNVINDASSSNHTITSQGNSIPTKFIPFS